MKKSAFVFGLAFTLAACGGGEEEYDEPTEAVIPDAGEGIAADDSDPDDSADAPDEPANPAPEQAAIDGKTIPVRFHGVWDVPGPTGCNGASDGVLEIKAQSLQFWESTGTVTGVTPAKNGGVDVATEMAGEGEEWTATHNLLLKGSSLMLATDGGTAYERTRCP